MNNAIQNGISVIKETAKSTPESPGIYKMISSSGIILYIGKAKNLKKRVKSYTNIEKMPYRLKFMVSQIAYIEIFQTKTEEEALITEAILVKDIQPKFNIQLKDGKSFPFIAIEKNHDFPRISKSRGKKDPKIDLFGPFISSDKVYMTIKELQQLFLIRPCNNNFFASRKRPCLQYQIKKCSAPCVGKVSKDEYAKLIEAAEDFLLGRSFAAQNILHEKMLEASRNMQYEMAASYRDRISMLTQVQSINSITSETNSLDIIAHYLNETGDLCIQLIMIRNGQNYGTSTYFLEGIIEDILTESIESFAMLLYQSMKPPSIILFTADINTKLLSNTLKAKLITPSNRLKSLDTLSNWGLENARTSLNLKIKTNSKYIKLLEEVQDLFELPNPIQRIEVYDNSHIQGTNPVGCYIVAGPGGFIKAEYRTYKLEAKPGKGDDYAMLRQVLTRRANKMNEYNRPDLIMIDGGAGHLSTAYKILENLDIPIVCIAKGEDRNAGREFFHVPGKEPFQLPEKSELLRYLQSLRNEVHNFAILTHRKQRAKNIVKSGLDAIPSIGQARKKALLLYFGSVEAIKGANIQQLTNISGISQKTAKLILHYLHTDHNTLN